MLSVLEKLNFSPPNLDAYESPSGLSLGVKEKDKLILSINNEQWMLLNLTTWHEVFEFYSHYDVAKGHCVCTGLGMALRESWLLNKSEVSKLTVLEKNAQVIEFHKTRNPDLLSRMEVINVDANDYKGSCDTLLLDHFEFIPWSNPPQFFIDVQKCVNNINHDTLWFWPLEKFLIYYPKVYEEVPLTPYDYYCNFRKTFPTLPILAESKLRQYCFMFAERRNLEIN